MHGRMCQLLKWKTEVFFRAINYLVGLVWLGTVLAEFSISLKNQNDTRDCLFDCADQRSGVFPDDPRGHATLILNDGCLQRIDHLPAQFFRELYQKRLIH